MKRALWVVLSLLSCSTYRALDRGDWMLVWSEEQVETQIVNKDAVEIVKPVADAHLEVISADRFRSEVNDGKRRRVGAPTGEPKHFKELKSPLVLKEGDVCELIIDEPSEPQEAQVQLAGDAAFAHWSRRHEKESTVFIIADEPGSSSLKVQTPGKPPHILDIEVTPR